MWVEIFSYTWQHHPTYNGPTTYLNPSPLQWALNKAQSPFIKKLSNQTNYQLAAAFSMMMKKVAIEFSNSQWLPSPSQHYHLLSLLISSHRFGSTVLRTNLDRTSSTRICTFRSCNLSNAPLLRRNQKPLQLIGHTS